MTTKILTVAIIFSLATASVASAKRHVHFHWLPAHHQVSKPRVATCPIGVPTQTFTVVNLAGVSTTDLAKVERAATDQSLQVRRWWGTPCVKFGPGGALIRLSTGLEYRSDGTTTYQLGGNHTPDGSIYVTTGDLPVTLWARALTHEIVEREVDPTDTVTTYGHYSGELEICDPVENESAAYMLDGLMVTDFVTPAFYTDGAGPYDQAGRQASGI